MNDFSENSPTGNVIDPMSAAMLAAKNGKDRPTARRQGFQRPDLRVYGPDHRLFHAGAAALRQNR